ncbi:PA14 domain-containing protein [Streptomyces nogalater]
MTPAPDATSCAGRRTRRWTSPVTASTAAPRPDVLRHSVATVVGTTFTDTTSGGTTHLYEIRAVDKSGNASAGTSDVSVTGNPAYLRQFFANTSFSGTPKRTDCDTAVNENWRTGSPGISGIGADNFGVRWQITRDFGSGGPFTFTASGQDGIRVYLDGTRKIDLWKNGSGTVSRTVNVTIPRGTHTLRVDYVNWTGAATVNLAYTPAPTPPRTMSPHWRPPERRSHTTRTPTPPPSPGHPTRRWTSPTTGSTGRPRSVTGLPWS